MKFHESSSERGNVIFTIDMPLMGPKWLVIQISDNSDKIPKSYGSICIESEAKISIILAASGRSLNRWSIYGNFRFFWILKIAPIFLRWPTTYQNAKNKLSLTVPRSGKAAEPSSSVLLVAKRKQKTENLTFSVQNTELACVVFSKGKVSKHAKH